MQSQRLQRFMLIFAAIAFCISTGACLTSGLETKYNRKPSTEENVRQYMISQDMQQLVVLGSKHHFIFPVDTDLKDILAWQGRNNIRLYGGDDAATSAANAATSAANAATSAANAATSKQDDATLVANAATAKGDAATFEASRDGEVDGESYLIYPLKQATADDLVFLQSHGFTCSEEEQTCTKSLRLIDGKMYDASKFKPSASLNTFSQVYKIRVNYNYPSTEQNLKRLALTPLALAGDAVIITAAGVGVVLLIPLMPFMEGLNFR